MSSTLHIKDGVCAAAIEAVLKFNTLCKHASIQAFGSGSGVFAWVRIQCFCQESDPVFRFQWIRFQYTQIPDTGHKSVPKVLQKLFIRKIMTDDCKKKIEKGNNSY